MIQSGQIETLAEGIHDTTLGVGRTIDQARHPGVHDGADAHQAGLQGDIQGGGAGQAVIAK